MLLPSTFTFRYLLSSIILPILKTQPANIHFVNSQYVYTIQKTDPTFEMYVKSKHPKHTRLPSNCFQSHYRETHSIEGMRVHFTMLLPSTFTFRYLLSSIILPILKTQPANIHFVNSQYVYTIQKTDPTFEMYVKSKLKFLLNNIEQIYSYPSFYH